jgi:hypothetical protein
MTEITAHKLDAGGGYFGTLQSPNAERKRKVVTS